VYCAYVQKAYCAVVHTLFQTRRHSAVVTKVMTVCIQGFECQCEEIQKAWVNRESNYDSLNDSQKRKIAFWATLSGLRGTHSIYSSMESPLSISYSWWLNFLLSLMVETS